MQISTREKNVFDKINEWIRGTEGSFVNLISAIAPWGAPAPVAYMTYEHCVNALHFPVLIAIITALVVEALGISSISTALSFWAHNKKFTDSKNQSPLWLAIGTFAFYIVLVLSLNVVLDAEQLSRVPNLALGEYAVTGGMILGRALLSLLSIPAGVLLATRAEQTELINNIGTQENIDQKKLNDDRAFELERLRIEGETKLQLQRDEQEHAHKLLLEQQQIQAQIRAEEAAERERMAQIEADLKVKKAAIRRGVPVESFTKVSESFQDTAAESSDFANLPSNWRKMNHDQKSRLAEYIYTNGKEKTAADFNRTVRTVENWIGGLIGEDYLTPDGQPTGK